MAETDKVLKYRIKDFTEIAKSFDFRNPELAKIQNILEHEFVFDFTLNVLPFPNQVYIGIITTVNVFLDTDKKVPIGNIEVVSVFEINKLEHLWKDGKIILSDQTLYVFVTAAIGTTRGILMNDLNNTPLHKVFLPLIPIKPLLEDLREKINIVNNQPALAE